MEEPESNVQSGKQSPATAPSPAPATEETVAATAEAPARPEPVNSAVNGHSNTPDEEEANGEDNLTPPPDSPISSPPVHTFKDEIVVGTKATNGIQSSPLRVTSDQEDEDVEMAEAEEKSQSPIATYPKRKRASVYNELDEDKLGESTAEAEPEATPMRIAKPNNRHGLGGVKGVQLGYWRESLVEDEEDRHAVIGFIDVRDRLRTRIQPTNRAGTKNVHKEHPIPSGPGGSWITFPGVVFDKHLVNLDHNQVKEYVRIRTDQISQGEADADVKDHEIYAVKEAIRRVQANPPPETAQTPHIAYGRDIPEHAVIAQRPDKKRRIDRMALEKSRPSPGPVPVSRVPLDNLAGTRPTKILVGYWKGSSEEKIEDKHAVYGILGANDMFRVKVTRETRDGRPVIGNFPTGAGALWIHYEEVEFDTHLKQLSRPEMKEYVRVRQCQIDANERPEDRIDNETKAVYEAQARVTSSFQPNPNGAVSFAAPFQPIDSAANGAESKPEHGDTVPKREVLEPRPSRRNFPETREASRPARHSLPDAAELRAANRPQQVDHIARTNSIARREIARVEMVQQRNDQRAANREMQPSGVENTKEFNDNMARLQKVWLSQETNRIKAGAEDAKMYNGVKYERKQSGPFQGKLVSQGTIISIDGEDYVEYRVLTKPSFF